MSRTEPEMIEWARSYGDPRDEGLYFTEEEFSEALDLIDGLQRAVARDGDSGALAAAMGFHPPSLFNYALGHAERVFASPTARDMTPIEVSGSMWTDGVYAGMLLILLLVTAWE